MLHKIPVFTRVLCGILCAISVLLCLCGGTQPTPGAIHAEDGGAGEWCICLSVSDFSANGYNLTLTLEGELPPHAAPSAVAAVRVTVELPTAWRVTAVERQGNADDPITVTVSAEGSRAVIVADGEIKDLVGLAVFISATNRATMEEASDPNCVTAHSEGVAYYDAIHCAVANIPVTGARLEAAAWGGAGDITREESATEPPVSEEPTTAPSPSDEQSPPVATLVGCQETPCADGQFSVRFIYRITSGAAGQGTPLDTGVVCLVGRGVIEAEVTAAGSITAWEGGVPTVTVADTTAHSGGEGAYFLLVTFRGLDARGTWVFRAERGDGQRVIIHWQDGNFWGWSDAKPPKTENLFW